ncbi:class II fructose-bisphosphatase [Enterobacter hormaechei]|uniref:class II fructose-bisphosphatase n=1 Tax=Enterobacter hormaechei TaxID=158836 RepID=UPI0020224FB7|nr:class II fructose-bisphosphatase [Enterobacter hormaechei]MCL8085638.1 class II fructose-bisphosphatase [Enterobacter hormaechei]MCL8195531.1 class II fructose-bisphosphatase [Enterobacter hormaechei]MCM7118556.1 class II fructose-bisphosphatase [Enterobacter hormaechei]MCM8483855.1 class II fructose-bisphosphatase [Enterobacter hormaechei]MDF3720063.1 class II fructose-bisphosphatase [Enterobacter hormaechei]
MMSLAWPLFRVTEQAALAAWPQTGCGDKNRIDGLAVTAMREALNAIAMRGRIVIGEGEIDYAPMLWIGEEVGSGIGPAVDIAVDPIEGTRMVAMGQSNALAVMAFAPEGRLFHAPDMYMKKLVVNAAAAGAISLDLPLAENLRNVARALGKPRLQNAIAEATQLGVKVFALPDGDVAASVLTCLQDNPYDLMYTTGGAPEGVISACAVKALGGDMQAELIDFCEAKGESPENRRVAVQEHRRCAEMKVEVNRIYTLSELVKGNDILFSATGVTGGELVKGIQQVAKGVRTQTLLIGGADRTCNIIDSLHSR